MGSKRGHKYPPGFGEWLRRLRASKNFTVASLSLKTNIHEDVIRALELDRRTEQTPIEVLVLIADALNIELAYLLHRAGFDIGAGGVKVAALARLEEATEVFAEQTDELRATLAEAASALDQETGLGEADRGVLADRLRRGLMMVDLLSARMAEHGFTPEETTGPPASNRRWTPEELEILRTSPGLSHRDLAKKLGRSMESVRFARRRFSRDRSDTNDGSASKELVTDA